MKGVFVANGNEAIGMGHIMRCMAIAEVMLEKHVHVEFLTKYESGKAFILNKGFVVFSYKDIDALEILLESKSYDFIVIDSYEVDESFFGIFKKHTEQLVYIDDLNLFDYSVDMEINTAVGAEQLDYKHGECKRYLLGSQYAILRKEFRMIEKRTVREKVEDIFITTGGSDAHNMTYTILNFLKTRLNSKNIKYHVIIGPAFKNSEDLYKAFAGIDNIIFYNAPGNMADIMNKCDIAISAGGNTLYELCGLGIPTIAFIYADNQKQFVEHFVDKGCVESIGDYNNIEYKYFEYILFSYIDDYGLRGRISHTQIELVDGQGVYRIAENILSRNKFL